MGTPLATQNSEPQNSQDPSKPGEAFGKIKQEYMLVEKTHVKPWQAWLILGVVSGAAAGMLLVASRSGDVGKGQAAPEETGVVSQDVVVEESEVALSQGEGHAEGEIIVKYREGAAPTKASLGPDGAVSPGALPFSEKSGVISAEMILDRHAFRDAAKQERIRATGLDRLITVRLASGKNIQEAVAVLEVDPKVEYAEPNYAVSIDAIPDDPNFPSLWGLHNIGQRVHGRYGTLDADIDGPEAWDIAKESSIVVGVIDTGIDYTHEDLAANIWTNPGEIPGNGKDDDGNGFKDDVHGWDFFNKDSDPMDDHSHGTHVAGIIGAVGNNGLGVTGVNWSARIAAIKFLSYAGTGRISHAVRALAYADMMGMKVTNNSWGCYWKRKKFNARCNSRALYDAIAASNGLGNLFVAAAGNDNWNNDDPAIAAFPASYDLPNIVSVAAINADDLKSSFSNYGAISVDLGAPGEHVISSVPKRERMCTPQARKAKTCQPCPRCDPSGYKMFSGTSMAAPYVSGAAALFWSMRPALSNLEVKQAILNSVIPIPALAGKTASGGRLNLHTLLRSP